MFLVAPCGVDFEIYVVSNSTPNVLSEKLKVRQKMLLHTSKAF